MNEDAPVDHWLDTIFASLVPTWLDREWSAMSEAKQAEWAKLLTDCAECGAQRTSPCQVHGVVKLRENWNQPVTPPFSYYAHDTRMRMAEKIYTHRREMGLAQEALKICPWCGLKCPSVAELAVHEKGCE